MTLIFYIILVLSVPQIKWHWGWFALSLLLCCLEGCGKELCKKTSCCNPSGSSKNERDDIEVNRPPEVETNMPNVTTGGENNKKAIVYYSFEGNTRLIAENIAQKIDADIIEIKPEKEIPSKGFMKYFWGGKAAMTKEKPELEPLDKDLNEYDTLFIGTPVWAFTYAPPFRSLFDKYPLSNKKIALFCCHGGGKGEIFNKMKDALSGNQILGQIDFQEPLKHNTDFNVQRAKNWAEDMIKKG